MEKNFNDISFIEAWLKGEMKTGDRQAFEAQLATDEVLQQEVAAYRQIFSGFQAARRENFAAEVGKWTQQAKAVSAEKPIHNIQSAKSNQGKVVQMKRGGVGRPLWQKLAMAAGFMLVVGAAAFWWMSCQYTDEKLVASAYLAPVSENTMGSNSPQATELENKFQAAHRLFQDKNYLAASTAMSLFIKDLEADRTALSQMTYKMYLNSARWTKLLADFACGQVKQEDMLKILDFMERQSDPDFAGKVREFREGLNSPWR